MRNYHLAVAYAFQPSAVFTFLITAGCLATRALAMITDILYIYIYIYIYISYISVAMIQQALAVFLHSWLRSKTSGTI